MDGRAVSPENAVTCPVRDGKGADVTRSWFRRADGDGTATRLAAPLRVDLACAVVVALGTLLHVAYYFPRVVDDLFISLRYAENLAHGHGAVYNVGERVEGYSGPSWMALQALGIALRFEAVTWTKLLGVASLLSIELALFAMARRVFRVAGVMAWLPAAFCAADSYVVNWSVLGLETPLHLAALAWCPVALHELLERDTRRARWLAVAALVALLTSRPESPMYAALCVGAPLLTVRSRDELRDLARRLVRGLWPAAAITGALLLARLAYYGHLVPNTYFIKGSSHSFHLANAAPLWTEGAAPWEAALFVGGPLLLLAFGWRARALAPALCAFACVGFTCSVILDWMPSLRHLLPVTVLAPLGFTVAADRLRARARGRSRAWALVPVGVVALSGFWIAQIDNRFSPEERHGRDWILPKSLDAWRDTQLAYRRIEPPHVARMSPYDMGQITQAWGVLEASAEPVATSWYAGRDIGAVGYYTGVRVFDTAGLFTPAVSHAADWTERRRVSDAMLEAMMALRPLAGEVYEGWETALGRRRDLLRGYRVRVAGPGGVPIAWIATDRTPPAPAEVVRRYRAMAAKFPRWFHLQTLYGETVGAAVERRLRLVEGQHPEVGDGVERASTR